MIYGGVGKASPELPSHGMMAWNPTITLADISLAIACKSERLAIDKPFRQAFTECQNVYFNLIYNLDNDDMTIV